MQTVTAKERAKLIALVERAWATDTTEDNLDALIAELESRLVRPGITDLMFWSKVPMTAEQVIDEALSYEPFAL